MDLTCLITHIRKKNEKHFDPEFVVNHFVFDISVKLFHFGNLGFIDPRYITVEYLILNTKRREKL